MAVGIQFLCVQSNGIKPECEEDMATMSFSDENVGTPMAARSRPGGVLGLRELNPNLATPGTATKRLGMPTPKGSAMKGESVLHAQGVATGRAPSPGGRGLATRACTLESA